MLEYGVRMLNLGPFTWFLKNKIFYLINCKNLICDKDFEPLIHIITKN